MRKYLFPLIILLGSQGLHAETFDNQGRRQPSEPEESACLSFQNLERDESHVLFLKHETLDVDTHDQSYLWETLVCPSDCNRKFNAMVFYQAPKRHGNDPIGPETGYSFDTSFIHFDYLNDQKMEAFVQKLRNECKMPFLQAKLDKSLLALNDAERLCAKQHLLRSLYSKWNLENTAKTQFKKDSAKAFIDFYQTCYGELHKTYL